MEESKKKLTPVEIALLAISLVLAIVALVVKIGGSPYCSERVDYITLILVFSPAAIYLIAKVRSIKLKDAIIEFGAGEKEDIKKTAEKAKKQNLPGIEKAKGEYQNTDYKPKMQLIFLFGKVEYKLRLLIEDHTDPFTYFIEKFLLLGDELFDQLYAIEQLRNKLAHGEPINISAEYQGYYTDLLYSLLSELDEKIEEKDIK